MKKLKISIIGAGPAGCYTAFLLAKRGFDVSVYEQKSKIGKIQCGGLVTATIEKVDKIFQGGEFNKCIINKAEKAKIYSENDFILFEFKKSELILDRIKFDNFIAKKARKSGAKIYLNSRFVGIIKKDKNKIIFRVNKDGKIKTIETDILIGADGALSRVAKVCGVKHNLELAIEARAKVKNIPAKMHQDFFDKKISPYPFAWIIPESSNAGRIGLWNSIEKFKKFLEMRNAKILDMRSGYVPIDKPGKCGFNNIYLVGDAGCHVKASTGGGIVPSLEAAQILAKSIAKGENYDKNLKKFKKQLYMHYIARKFLNKFSNKDFDELFSVIKETKIKKIFETYSRDEPQKFLSIFLIPKFLLFAIKKSIKILF